MNNELFIDQFVCYLRAERHYSEKTIMVYEPVLVGFSRYVEEQTSRMDWGAIRSEDVREWLVSQMERGDSPVTVNKRLSALRSFYKYLLMRELVKADPTRKVQGPKKEKKLPSFVRERDMDKLFDETTFADDFEGKRDRLILLLFYSTGIRLSELVGLDVESVDFYTSTIKVLGKRNKERIIPFGQELKDALEVYIVLRTQQPNGNSSPALFLGKKGPRITTSTVGNIVRFYLSQVTTVQKKSPHVLRHSFATAMLNNGAEIEVVRQLLGHESIATTEIYTHTTFEELKKIYAKAHPRADDKD